ncbi:methyltransferase [Xanthocytophaga flava]|uniref:methyltransferase n=1 Tax=Xanthocytophaga flava TaxID=3048013 RepID=UPI0028D1AA97|nr:methyltransferase [Xanthocytophaga flavus]MDJ1471781.1 methyltransferase [Xanthocytophaga flavus]
MSLPFPDIAPITRHLRAKASSHLLVAAVHHLPVFEILSHGPLSITELQEQLAIKNRPAMVLFPALCAMGMICYTEDKKLSLTELGRYLTKSNLHNLIGYAGLEKDDPGVLTMVQHLLNDGPVDTSQGVSYVKDDEAPSPMDDPEAARMFTLALAGRARYLSPIVASHLPNRQGHLLDVAGGTGYYTYEWLRANPQSTATVVDRPAVLKVAAELLEEFCNSDKENAADIRSRVLFFPADMLTDPLPQTDFLLAASLFHDWPEDICQSLAQKFANALRPNGEIWIHDAFLDDTLDGPLAVTDYSAMLFLGTKGRAYSRKEYRQWFSASGLVNVQEEIPTLLDYGLIHARKPL